MRPGRYRHSPPFPPSHLGEGARLLTGPARFETVGGSQFILPVAQLDEQRATDAKVCRFESCPEGQSTACRGAWPSSPALEAGDRVFKSHHADQFAFIDPWRNRNAAVCKTVMSRGSTGRVIHTPFAGLGHRLITWLPTRQSRF